MDTQKEEVTIEIKGEGEVDGIHGRMLNSETEYLTELLVVARQEIADLQAIIKNLANNLGNANDAVCDGVKLLGAVTAENKRLLVLVGQATHVDVNQQQIADGYAGELDSEEEIPVAGLVQQVLIAEQVLEVQQVPPIIVAPLTFGSQLNGTGVIKASVLLAFLLVNPLLMTYVSKDGTFIKSGVLLCSSVAKCISRTCGSAHSILNDGKHRRKCMSFLEASPENRIVVSPNLWGDLLQAGLAIFE